MSTEFDTGIEGVGFSTDFKNPPAHFLAADTLSRANGSNEAELFLGDALSFTEATLASAAINLANIPIDLGNAFGADIERINTQEVLTDLDDDLGLFYGQHKDTVDLAGFIISSFVPGMAGVKLLRAGQTYLAGAAASGKLGKGLSLATGLLAPPKKKFIDTAVSQIVNGSSPVALTNANVLKALASGMGQEVLEAAAFEIATAATLFNSPVLENQTFGETVSNIVSTSLVWGGVAGALSGAVTYRGIKGAVQSADKAIMPWKYIEAPAPTLTDGQKLSFYFDQYQKIPEVPTEGLPQFSLSPTFMEATAARTKEKLSGAMYASLRGITGEDEVLTNLLFDKIKNVSHKEGLETLVDLEEVTRGAAGNSIIAARKELQKSVNKIKTGGSADITPSDLDFMVRTNVGHWRTWGEEAGRVSSDPSPALYLTDKLAKGETISVHAGGVQAGKYRFNFETPKYSHVSKGLEVKGDWNLLYSDPMEANARYLWASKLEKFSPPTPTEPLIIGKYDIPLLEKAILDLSSDPRNFDNVLIREPGDSTPTILSLLDPSPFKYLKKVKEEAAQIIETSTQKGEMFSSLEDALVKLQTATGIDLSLMKVGQMVEGQAIAANTRGLAITGKDYSRIFMEEAALLERPFHESVITLLHEQGHVKHRLFERLGNASPEVMDSIREEIKVASRKADPKNWAYVNNVIKKIQKLSPDQLAGNAPVPSSVVSKSEVNFVTYKTSDPEMIADAFAYFSIFPEKLVNAPKFAQYFGDAVRPLPKQQWMNIYKRAKTLDAEEIAAMVNVKHSLLGKGIASGDEVADYLAIQDHMQKFGEDTVLKTPQHVGLGYRHPDKVDLDIKGRAVADALNQLAREDLRRVSATVLGDEIYSELDEITSNEVLAEANRLGAGAGLVTSAAGDYGSLPAKTENMGRVTIRAIDKKQTATREVLDPVLRKLGTRPAAAIEAAQLDNTLRAIPAKYTLDPAADRMIPVEVYNYKYGGGLEAGAPAPVIKEGFPAEIPIKNAEVRDWVQAHIELNGKRVKDNALLGSAKGSFSNRDPLAYYPVPKNPTDFPSFALITDESITGIGRSSTLYAKNEAELQAAANKILSQNPSLKVRYRQDAEDYFRDIGQWDYDKSLSENYIDITKHRSGVSASYLVPTDPQKIISDFLTWHLQRDAALVREAVVTNSYQAFDELARLGNIYTAAATSKMGGAISKYAGDVTKNPYADFAKTALGLKKYSDYPWWVQSQRMLDEKFSQVFNKIHAIMDTRLDDAAYAEVNSILQEAGYKGAHYDAEMALFANAQADRNILNATVQKANSILATVALRWDYFNAAVNTISHSVLLGSETNAILKMIKQGGDVPVGKLKELAHVDIPGNAQGKSMFSTLKLINNSIKKFGRDTPDFKWFQEKGFITHISDQYKYTLDQLTFTGDESVKVYGERVSEAHSKLSKLAQKGEKITGNRLAEEFTRFVSADIMKQLTDPLVTAGKMAEKEQLAYINSFVNKVHGNYLSAQRPMLFSGAVGQAIGLFQTYQFNIMQQLLRHVGEGRAKDAMTLLGIQGTLFGLHGLPAFDAVNTHIIGTLSGNQEHRDAYSTVYGAAGKQAGDWLMYGVASNMFSVLHPDLKTNLYTRGDINPRHLTIVPTSASSVPIVQTSARFVNNILDMAGTLMEGGAVGETVLRALEHNALNRPLSGLAVTLEGMTNPHSVSYSTSQKGNVIAANDMYSLISMVRMAGGKPLDEAAVQDAVYRFKSYALADAKKKTTLGKAIKTHLAAGQDLDPDELEKFIETYAARGGDIKSFNKWAMSLYKSANVSQAEQLRTSLNSPFSQTLQKMMGGFEGLEE